MFPFQNTASISPFPILFAASILAIGLFTDIRYRIIPNALTVPAVLAGVVFHAFEAGLADGVSRSVCGALIGGALLFGFFALGGMGGGDVKLLSALGAWMGAAATLSIFVYGAFAAAGVCLWRLVRRRPPIGRGDIRQDLMHVIFAPGRVSNGVGSVTIPYTPAVAFGFIVYLLRGAILS